MQEGRWEWVEKKQQRANCAFERFDSEENEKNTTEFEGAAGWKHRFGNCEYEFHWMLRKKKEIQSRASSEGDGIKGTNETARQRKGWINIILMNE